MRDKDHVVVLFYNFYEDTTFLLSSIYRSDEAYIIYNGKTFPFFNVSLLFDVIIYHDED